MKKITSKIIANFLSQDLIGKDIKINGACSIDNIKDYNFFFINSKFTKNINVPNNTLAIAPKKFKISKNSSLIISSNPRRDFIKTINKFFLKNFDFKIDKNTRVPKSCLIDSDVYIGKNVTIGENVQIGKKSKIFPNVYIGDNVKIGSYAVIKPGAVLGSSGFGYDFDKNGEPIEFNHIGSVQIGNNVHIGANTCIDQGTLNNTIIEDNVKIDNLVHLSHNCIVKKNSIIAASAEISGGVIIEESCWISPNVSIKQKCHIGKKSLIGMGAVVINDIPKNTKVTGISALTLREYVALKKQLIK